MKIQHVIAKKVRTINICHSTKVQGKTRNKMFNAADIKQALDYCLTIDDLYISTCSHEIRTWAEKTDHDILSQKSWVFAQSIYTHEKKGFILDVFFQDVASTNSDAVA